MPIPGLLLCWLLLPFACSLLCTLWTWRLSGHWDAHLTKAARRSSLIGCAAAATASLLLTQVDTGPMLAGLLAAATLLSPLPCLRALTRGMEAQKQLELAQWQRDGLTGLLTRKAFMEQAMTLRKTGGGGMILLDIDHFKRINDQHLHAGGDRVLAHVARRLAAQVRITDLLGRQGGEEFCLLLPDKGGSVALELAERLLADARAQKVRMPCGREQGYTLSAGVASCSRWPGTAAGWEELTHRADTALYAAKRSGRDRAYAAEQLGSPALSDAPPLNHPALKGLHQAAETS